MTKEKIALIFSVAGLVAWYLRRPKAPTKQDAWTPVDDADKVMSDRINEFKRHVRFNTDNLYN